MNGRPLPTDAADPMQGALPFASSSVLNWVPVGEPPPAVEAWRAARMTRLRPTFSVAGGVVMGVISGAAALAVWLGAFSWPLRTELELFGAVVVGVADFFTNYWFLTWIARASRLHVKRLALAQGRVYLDLSTGTTFESAGLRGQRVGDRDPAGSRSESRRDRP